MIKKISKLNTIYNGELNIKEETLYKIKTLWDDFIKDKNSNDFFDGDIYCVTDIDGNIPLITFYKTKYSSLIYAKQTNNLIVRSLFSAGYVKTSDDYICIILNNRNILNTIGGMASNEDIIDNKFDYCGCFIREFKEELGIDLSNNDQFTINLKYLKYPGIDEINNSFYPVGTLFEVNTKYTSNELLEIFNNSKHESEVKVLKFYNQNTYNEIYDYDNKTDYLDELFDLIFK